MNTQPTSQGQGQGQGQWIEDLTTGEKTWWPELSMPPAQETELLNLAQEYLDEVNSWVKELQALLEAARKPVEIPLRTKAKAAVLLFLAFIGAVSIFFWLVSAIAEMTR